MKTIRNISALVILAVLMICCSQSQEPNPSIVKVVDGKFQAENYPSHFVGTNFWYGAILGSEGKGGDRERLKAELDTLKALGMVNLRVLVGGDGPDGLESRISPTLQKEPGVYNDTIFWGLDYLLTEMGKRDMKAVLYINNSWEWSGGYGMYLQWAGEGEAVLPSVVGYQGYIESVSKFLTNEKAKQMYYDHVKNIVTRTNTVTGKAYKDDPAIFSWQICNEPRCFSKDTVVRNAFVDYLWKSAELIKSLDPNHMVSTGSEGYYGCEANIEFFERIHSCPDIDYLTVHVWPYNWGWVREKTLITNLDHAIERTDWYIDMHLDFARKNKKPIVMEEFGFPRDDFQFAKGTPTTARDAYYKYVLDRIIEAAKTGDVFAGMNFWGWGGLADQNLENTYWKEGDDYCGDPAQEQQGLNSVYASDVSTVAILKNAADEINRTLNK